MGGFPGVEDATHTYEYEGQFKILSAIYNWSADSSRINRGVRVGENYMYTSDKNPQWMPVEKLHAWINAHRSKIGAI